MGMEMEISSDASIECPYKVRVQEDKAIYWGWCCTTLVIGQWKKMIGFMGRSATYCFHNAEDATAFKLIHSL
jgi:hypothetical protein